jgi:Domain of unknown function (DUF6265)
MLVLFALPIAAQTAVDQLAWMAGCWQGVTPARTVEEHWMKPSAGVMLGMSRTAAGGKLVATEFLSIEPRDGKLAYVARPSGQAMEAFPLVKASSTEVVFENLAHDFPQRIIYRKTPEGLHARVEAADGKKSQDFPMKAVSCN